MREPHPHHTSETMSTPETDDRIETQDDRFDPRDVFDTTDVGTPSATRAAAKNNHGNINTAAWAYPYQLDAGARPLTGPADQPPAGHADADLTRDGDLLEYYASRATILKSFRENLCARSSFLPFAARERNPLRLTYHIGQYIQDLPPTRKYITRGHLVQHLPMLQAADGKGNDASRIRAEMLLVHGAYPADGAETNADTEHFANPNYVHQQTVPKCTERADRIEWLTTYARLGVLSASDIAPHFGVKTGGVYDAIARYDFDWEAERERGRRIIGRTWAIMRAWGYTQQVIADAFGVDRRVVYDLCKLVRERGFHAPETDPSIPVSLRSREAGTTTRVFDHTDIEIRAAEPAPIERHAADRFDDHAAEMALDGTPEPTNTNV